jgi:hypothetical protein
MLNCAIYNIFKVYHCYKHTRITSFLMEPEINKPGRHARQECPYYRALLIRELSDDRTILPQLVKNYKECQN